MKIKSQKLRVLLSLLVVLLFNLNTYGEYAQDELPIIEHMRSMYELKDSLFESLDVDASPEVSADIIVKLREHLHAIMPKVPVRVETLTNTEKRLMHLGYQKLVAKVVLITIELEEVILKPTANNKESSLRADKIKNLVMDLQFAVSKSHTQFR